MVAACTVTRFKTHPSPSRVLSPWIHAKWLAFRSLEAVADALARIRRGTETEPGSAAQETPRDRRERLWIFASTIGELNAIEPFLRRFLVASGNPPLLLVSDHGHYRDAFLTRHPAAHFLHLQSGSANAARAVRDHPPRGLLIAEMPCMLSDAPGRFSFGVVYAVKRSGVPVCVVNGWLYRNGPASRIDAIEKRLFDRSYLRLIDLMLVQNDEIRGALIDHGADPKKVAVTGNIKFDGTGHTGWTPDRARDPALMRAIAATRRPCIVAGCVTNLPDQEAILDAFRATLAAVPDALLVLAPRHPEVTERMRKLESFLQARGFAYAFRSRLDGVRFDRGMHVLVLDTMGELKDFYALATLTYVGPNHNVLEPLAFDKPVFVLPGWEPTYPSFPVYRLLLTEQAIIEVGATADLAQAWIGFLKQPGLLQSQRSRIEAVLAAQAGATERALEAMAASGFVRTVSDAGTFAARKPHVGASGAS